MKKQINFKKLINTKIVRKLLKKYLKFKKI